MVAHEVTHAIGWQIGLTDFGESGALRSPFATSSECSYSFAALPATADWQVGNNPLAPGFNRALNNPKAPGGDVPPGANTYEGEFWLFPTGNPNKLLNDNDRGSFELRRPELLVLSAE